MLVFSVKQDTIFSLFLLLVFFCLALQYKIVNQETYRPLHYVGIILLFVGIIALIILKGKGLIRIKGLLDFSIIVHFLFLYWYIFYKTIFMNSRAIKDNIIGSTVDLLFFLFILLYILYKNQSYIKTISLLSNVVILFAVVSSIIALVIHFYKIDVLIGSFPILQSPFFDGRIHGLLGNPTSLGGLCGLGIISIIYLFFNSRTKLKAFIYVIYLIILILTLLLSGSRNAAVSIIFSLTPLIFYKMTFRNIIKYQIIMLLIMLTGLVLVNVCSDGINHLNILFRATNIGTYLTRIDIWNVSFEILKKSSVSALLWGHGYNYGNNLIGSTFNIFLKFIIDYGIIFIVLFITLLYKIFYQFIKHLFVKKNTYRIEILPLGLLMYSLSFSFFYDGLFTGFFHFSNFSFQLAVVMASRIDNV